MSDFRQQALDYHSLPTPGKISVALTTPAETSEDLSLAYSPGVAEPVREIAANPDMIEIANRYKPHSVCFVPENRKEITTEGGLDVSKNFNKLEKLVKDELDNDINVSLFIDPDKDQIIATKDLGVKVVEFHTGAYAEAFGTQLSLETELNKIKDAVQLANDFNINCHAGHGLNFENVSLISSISNIKELNIGHFLISDAIFNGLENSIIKMKKIIKESTI